MLVAQAIPRSTPGLSFRVLFSLPLFASIVLVSLFFALSAGKPYVEVDLKGEGESLLVAKVGWAGLAKHAGVKVGDTVITVNGSPAGDYLKRQNIVRSRDIRSLEWLDSEGRLRSVSLEGSRATPATWIEQISLLILSLGFLVSGFIVGWKRPNRTMAMAFGLLCSGISIVIIGLIASESNVGGALEMQTVATIFTPWLFLHFCLFFPAKKRLLDRHPALPFSWYGPALVLLMVYVFSGRDQAPFYPMLRFIILCSVLLGLLLGLISLLHTLTTATFLRIRQQIKIPILATVVGILPFLLLGLFPEVLFGQQIVPASLGLLSTMLVPISLGYAMVKEELFDVDTVIRRGIVYASITSVLLFIYLAMWLILLNLSISEARRLSLLAAFLLAAVLLFNPVKEKISLVLDRHLYRDRYDSAQSIRTISTSFSSILDIKSLGHFLVASITANLGLRGAFAVLFDEKGQLRARFAVGAYADSPDEQDRLFSFVPGLDPEALFPNQAPPGSGAAFIVPLKTRAKDLGIIWLSEKSTGSEFTAQDLSFVFSFTYQAALSLENIHLLAESTARGLALDEAYTRLKEYASSLERTTAALERAYLDIAKALTVAQETRDPYSKGHSQRVASLSRRLGSQLGLGQKELDLIELAGIVHDIGKIGIPDGVLLKTAHLDLAERAQVELHPLRSVQILRPLGFLNEALPLVESHHEWYSGAGYPYGSKGEDIPLGARVLSVADAYVALTSSRPYRLALSPMEALEVLKRGAGTQWDPQIMDTFAKMIQTDLAKGTTSEQ